MSPSKKKTPCIISHMSFNPIKFTYTEGYKKITIKSFGKVIIEPVKGSNTSVRKLILPSSEGIEHFACRIVDIKKLETTWREVYSVKLDKAFVFKPGDSIGLLCPNSNLLVDEIMEILGIEDFSCRIERMGGNAFLYAGRIREFFKYHFDFASLPKKSMLIKLGESCAETSQRCIEYLCSKEGQKTIFGWEQDGITLSIS